MTASSKVLNFKSNRLFGIKLLFNEFRLYQKLMEGFLEQEKKDIKIKFEELEREPKENWEDGYYEHVFDGIIEQNISVSNDFTYNFRSAFFVQLMSFIEIELRKICEHYRLSNTTNFSIKDLKGSNDIEKAKLYLTKAAKVDFSKLEPEWSKIMISKDIRNIIVHHQGEMILDGGVKSNKIKNYIESSDSMAIIYNKVLENGRMVGHKYCSIEFKTEGATKDLIDITEKFFRNLLEEEIKN